jgi:uncharacterized protein (TIRG00374 family)
MKTFKSTLLVLGVVFLASLVWHVGPGELARQVRAVGWGVLVFILAEGVANLAHTLGWRHCINRTGPPVPLWRVFRMAMAGYAMNYLLPLASVGGEASKAALLSSSRPTPEAFSSVLLDKLSTAIAHLLLALLGAGLVIWQVHLPAEMLVAMIATTVLLAGGMGTFLLIQRYGKLGALLRWLTERRIGGDIARQASERISEVDAALQRFYREQPLDYLMSIGWHLLGHSAGLLQAWIFLWLLHQPSGLWPVACAGLLSLWFDLLTFAIPLNLGGLEGSRMVALKAIGNHAAAGMAFGICVRIAQLFWVAFGLACYGLFTIHDTGWLKARTQFTRRSPLTPRHLADEQDEIGLDRVER